MGIVLKEMKVGENDRLVTLLTREHGVIRAFCTGSLKSSSKSLSAAAFLSYSRFTVYKGRDTYKINDAHPEKIFWELRNDFTLLSLASYFCEVCMDLAPKEESAEDFLRLILNCLHLLTVKNESMTPEHIKAVFELRCCIYSGYMPDVTACCECKNEFGPVIGFDTLGGVCVCGKCFSRHKCRGMIEVSGSVIAAMRHIIYSPLEKCFSFKLNEKNEKSLSDLCENFLIAQTGRTFDTLQFYKTYKI